MSDEHISCAGMGDNKPTGTTPKRMEVVLRDLDNLLRTKLGDGIVVDSFTTSSLVSVGENYGSTILKVEANIRKGGQSSAELEELSLVAKMLPPTEYQRILFDTSFTFGKEIYMFTDIVPAYKALELEYGIPETEVFDPLPELYGSRLTLKEGESEVDEDAVILMENLKMKNYYCGNRKLGLDMPHAKLVVETLARFHADGIAVKLKKPNLFEDFKIRTITLIANAEAFGPMIEFLTKTLRKIPVLRPHLTRIEKAVVSYSEYELLALKPPAEPWGTIIHTDLWVNNIMFRDDEFGNPEKVKFVDFQGSGYQNPLQDLVFFLFTSCKEEVCAAHIGDLIDFYYDQLVYNLARLKCDVSLFSRSSFNEQLKSAANYEFPHCAFMIWVLVANVEKESNGDPEKMIHFEPSDVYRKRLAEISLRFLQEDWI